MSDKTREEAAADKFGELMGGGPTVGLDHHYTAQILAAADEADTANGVHRVTLGDATVERAAQAFLDAFYADPTLKVDDEDRAIVRAVLVAAVKEEQ